MRILHLTTEFPPVIYGGLGTAVGGWVKASAQAGVQVAVQLVEGPLVLKESAGAYGSPRRPSNAAELRAIAYDQGVTFFQSSWSSAIPIGIQAVQDWGADIVHLHTAMLWYLASALRQSTGKPVIYHVHSVDRAEYELGGEPNPWLAHSQAQEEAISVADRIIALGKSEADLIGLYYPFAMERVRVVPNGIDDTQEARDAAFRQRSGGGRTVLYAGRLVQRKGIQDLLDAIPEVLEGAPNTSFVLVGGPPPLSPSEVAEQWLIDADDRLRARVHFTGWLSPADIVKWYKAADILAVPSRYEPFGLVVLEGMLYGLAVVASDVGGPSEILEQWHTGLLFPPKDVKVLAASLRWLLENPDERRRIGRAAAVEVRKQWLWEQRVVPMVAVYDELLPGIS
jgi:glycogen synthase